jgi:hypothetical protein
VLRQLASFETSVNHDLATLGAIEERAAAATSAASSGELRRSAAAVRYRLERKRLIEAGLEVLRRVHR